jgi:hypothetical protein
VLVFPNLSAATTVRDGANLVTIASVGVAERGKKDPRKG